MNAVRTAAALIACSIPASALSALAQEPTTGVSTPPPALTESTQSAPGASVPEGYHPTPPRPALQPRQSYATLTPQPAPDAVHDPANDTAHDIDAGIVSGPLVSTMPHHTELAGDAADIDANIVGPQVHAANECPIGTTFKVRMHQTLSTESTAAGTPFSADVIDPIGENGRILIPTGTVLEGRVTEVHGGRRIHGAPALHLEPRNLILPDGSRYAVHGQVIDTSQSFATRIDTEGTILRRDHIKATLAAMSLTTGSAAVAGAVIGGGVGALVGAGIGAGIGAAWWLKQDRQTVLPQDTAVTFSLNEPITIGTLAR